MTAVVFGVSESRALALRASHTTETLAPVSSAFGSPATPPQVGSCEAVSNEISVDMKLNPTPVAMKLSSIDGTPPASRPCPPRPIRCWTHWFALRRELP
jgi:hypothetical protein